MGKTLEERIVNFTVDFVRAVARINKNLIYEEYYMRYGKTSLPFGEIARGKMTAEDCWEFFEEDQNSDVRDSVNRDCVGYMMCAGYLYDKIYGYTAYQKDIYGGGDEAGRVYHALNRITEKYNFWYDWSYGALIFYDNAYIAINHELQHEFYNGEKTEQPIVVLGPDGTVKTKMRVYAYGGLIGRIATGYGKGELANTDYAKYLKEECFSKDCETDKNYLLSMNEKYVNLEYRGIEYSESVVRNELYNRLKKIIEEPSELYLSDCSHSDEYLDLILKAAEKKFMKKVNELSERRVQTEIVRRHMKKDAKADWCVIDMEYAISKKVNPSGERCIPDIVVFDKMRGFGFIELKYENKSTENLSKHYKDIQNVMKDENAVKEIMDELIRRSEYLRNYDLISDTIYQSMKKSNVQSLWQGFLFFGGEKAQAVERVKICEEFIKDTNCRFAFYPYDEKHSDECFDNIKLNYQHMQAYGDFIRMA